MLLSLPPCAVLHLEFKRCIFSDAVVMCSRNKLEEPQLAATHNLPTSGILLCCMQKLAADSMRLLRVCVCVCVCVCVRHRGIVVPPGAISVDMDRASCGWCVDLRSNDANDPIESDSYLDLNACLACARCCSSRTHTHTLSMGHGRGSLNACRADPVKPSRCLRRNRL